VVKCRKIPPAAAANQIAENAKIPPAADLQKNKYCFVFYMRNLIKPLPFASESSTKK
jgi:hypothetical protein